MPFGQTVLDTITTQSNGTTKFSKNKSLKLEKGKNKNKKTKNEKTKGMWGAGCGWKKKKKKKEKKPRVITENSRSQCSLSPRRGISRHPDGLLLTGTVIRRSTRGLETGS